MFGYRFSITGKCENCGHVCNWLSNTFHEADEFNCCQCNSLVKDVEIERTDGHNFNDPF